MAKPINIYLQSRINEELPFNRVEKHSSGKIELCRIHEHEIMANFCIYENSPYSEKAIDAFIESLSIKAFN